MSEGKVIFETGSQERPPHRYIVEVERSDGTWKMVDKTDNKALAISWAKFRSQEYKTKARVRDIG